VNINVRTREVDAGTADDFWMELAPGLPSTKGGMVTVDLREVSFMDSTGLALLLKADRHLRSQDAGIVLINVQPAVARLLSVSGVGDYFLDRTARAS
jgi:anti-anti-sigma factor